MVAITSGQALRMAQHALFGTDTARIDAELLLGAALGATRAGLYARPERVLSPSEQSRFEALLERRILGEPVAYILGHGYGVPALALRQAKSGAITAVSKRARQHNVSQFGICRHLQVGRLRYER